MPATGTQLHTAGPLVTVPMARGASQYRVSITVALVSLANIQLTSLFLPSFFFARGFCDEVFFSMFFRSWIFNYE